MHHQIGQAGIIPKEIWGALISGLIGVFLFFLKSFFDARDKEKGILFQLYQNMIMPIQYHSGSSMDRILANQTEYNQKLTEITSLALLLKKKKNRKLGRKIIALYQIKPFDKSKSTELLSEIKKNINKKFIKELEESEAKQKSSDKLDRN